MEKSFIAKKLKIESAKKLSDEILGCAPLFAELNDHLAPSPHLYAKFTAPNKLINLIFNFCSWNDRRSFFERDSFEQIGFEHFSNVNFG